MTDEDKTETSPSRSFHLWPGFWTIVFVVLAATGNCQACGLDHDYVHEYTECPSDKAPDGT